MMSYEERAKISLEDWKKANQKKVTASIIQVANRPLHYPMLVATVLLNAKVVIECGTGPGTSLAMFIKAMKLTGGKVYSIDHNPKWKQNFEGLKSLPGGPDDVPSSFYKKYFTLIVGDSVDVGRTWDKGDIDVFYCDGNHGYKDVTEDLEAWGKFNPKLIFIHDTGGPGTNNKLGNPFRAGYEYAEITGRKFFNIQTTEGLGVII